MISQQKRSATVKMRLAVLLAAIALALCVPTAAFAASAFDSDTSQAAVSSSVDYNAGNMFALMHPVSNTEVENDLYWAGQTLDATKIKVGTSGHGSVIVAGQTISLSNGSIADSFRAAASSVSVDHTEIGNNVTIAAQEVSLGSGVSANGVYIAAETISLAGTYQGGSLAAATVSFDGTVKGDMSIQAQNITLGNNAQITGTLTVPENANVNLADGAQVANISYSAATDATASSESLLSDSLLSILYACMAHIVLVGLFFLIIRKSLVRSANMARTQLVKMLLAGLVVVIVAPLACLLLIFPLITIPVVVLMVLVMIIIALFSLPFTGAALGLMLLGKRMNPVLAAVIGTVVLTICAYLPYLSVLTVLFCIMFTAGYLWMCYWETHQQRKQERFAARQAAFVASQQAAGMTVPSAPTSGTAEPPAPTGNPVVPPAPTGNPVAPTNEPAAPTGEGDQSDPQEGQR